MPPIVEAVFVGYQPTWGKWPDSGDTDYNSVLGRRVDVPYVVDGEEVTLRVRWYPVHRAYAVAGILQTPVAHPYINNTLAPHSSVLDAMIYDLECLANDGVKLCLWEHVYQCYPYVAQHLRRIFKHSSLIHCDDSPGATEIKTQPVAGFFDSAILGNIIWQANGELTKDLYARLGVTETYYMTLSVTGGFLTGIDEWFATPQPNDGGCGIAPIRHGNLPRLEDFDLERRITQIRAGQYSHDLVFVGGNMGWMRGELNILRNRHYFDNSRLRCKFYGIGMRDGPLVPRELPDIGRPVAQLYLDSFACLNAQFIGLMGTRPFDAWASGTLLVQHDPVGEMAHVGAHPGQHFASFDGTIPDMLRVVEYYQQHLDETEAILRAGQQLAIELPKRYNMNRAIEQILARHRAELGW